MIGVVGMFVGYIGAAFFLAYVITHDLFGNHWWSFPTMLSITILFVAACIGIGAFIDKRIEK